MSLPYWSEIEYIDDGVYKFQCLNCEGTWKSRTHPWWENIDGEKFEHENNWKMCPICGCNWIGQKKNNY